MPRPSGVASYRAVLRIPGVLRPFAATTLGRLSYATLPLSLLLTVAHATGSFAVAGIALGVLSAATGVMPVKSRLVDVHGARRVLPPLAVAFCGALLGVAAAATAGVASPGVHLVLALVAGLAAPPLGPSMRALWAARSPEPAVRQRAYALDGVAEETVQVLGPVVVAAALAVGGSSPLLVLTALLNLGGTLGMAWSVPRPAAGPAPRTRRLAGPFHERGFGVLVVVVSGIGAGSAPLTVAVVARAQELDAPGLAPYLLAVLALGSTAGGLLWGRRTHRRCAAVQLTGLVAVMAAGSLAAAATTNLPVLAVVLLVSGLVNAPAAIVAYLAADRLVPDSGRTEATTWISTANNVGASLGVAGAGVAVEGAGTGVALLVGAAVLVLTAVGALLARRRLRTTAPARRRQRHR